jgi:hypothetical protein
MATKPRSHSHKAKPTATTHSYPPTKLALPSLQPKMARRRDTKPQDRVTTRPTPPKHNYASTAARTNVPYTYAKKNGKRIAGSEQSKSNRLEVLAKPYIAPWRPTSLEVATTNNAHPSSPYATMSLTEAVHFPDIDCQICMK